MKKIAGILVLLFCFLSSIFAQEQVKLKGKVTDEGNKSIKNITISIKGKDDPVKTDEEGKYMTMIQEGKYVVKFSAPGYATKTVIIEVVDNTELDIQLEKIQNSKSSRL